MTVEKKIKGRKRHIITDTEGFILGCYVGAANENDRDGLLEAIDNLDFGQITLNLEIESILIKETCIN